MSWLVEVHVEVDVGVDQYLNDPGRGWESIDIPPFVSEVPHREELENSQANSDIGKMLIGWALSCLNFFDSILTADLKENDQTVHNEPDEDKGEPIQISLIIVHGIVLITVSFKIGLVTGKFTSQSNQEEVEDSRKDVKIQGSYFECQPKQCYRKIFGCLPII